MLFNSIEFVFFFWPTTLLAFFLLGRRSTALALASLVLASVLFYAWWRPVNVPIIATSMAVNYVFARAIMRYRDAQRQRASTIALTVGIVFNVVFLGYFKYVNFLAGVVNDVMGTDFVLEQVVLPLGISFITFQKIAFLIDVHARRVETFTVRQFALFVMFFPQLIAGPIVHFREMMPQFQRASCRFDADYVSVGVTLFVIGLFKKVVLADGIAAHVSPVYELAASGTPVSILPAWIAAVGFTLQIYFDFSGYSDMAMGLARCFGVRLPANFDSPLKATSIIDFWLRWHMTLTRFLTAYLYNPLALAATRRRMGRGLAPMNVRCFEPSAFLQSLAVPTLLTMFISGFWHGAGYTFLLWGLLHGLYLIVNHAWRQIVLARVNDKALYERIMGPLGLVLTFLAVVVAMVLFRADSVGAAVEVLRGLFGLNGVLLPQAILDVLARVPGGLHESFGETTEITGRGLVIAVVWSAGLLGIALLMPNSLQVLGRFEPALVPSTAPPAPHFLHRVFEWRPSLAWALSLAGLALLAMSRIGENGEFLYWQF